MVANPFSWSTTNASNSTVEAISVAEGMVPAGVNNALRGIMVGVKEMLDLTCGAKTTGGSATEMTITTGLSLSAYAAGQAFLVESGFTTTGALTLNVDAIAAKAVTTGDGAALTRGSMTVGGMYLLAYESDGDDFILMNPDASGHPGSATVWAHTSMSGSTSTLREDYNVSSSTDQGTGIQRFTYDTVFNSVYYSCQGVSGLVDTTIDNSNDGRITSMGTRTTAYCELQCYQGSNYKDPDSYHFAAMGDI
jgi:hypothetical protein